jgi:hypothetical protein
VISLWMSLQVLLLVEIVSSLQNYSTHGNSSTHVLELKKMFTVYDKQDIIGLQDLRALF